MYIVVFPIVERRKRKDRLSAVLQVLIFRLSFHYDIDDLVGNDDRLDDLFPFSELTDSLLFHGP